MNKFTLDLLEHMELARKWVQKENLAAKEGPKALLDYIFERWQTGEIEWDQAISQACEMQELRMVSVMNLLDAGHRVGIAPSEIERQRRAYKGDKKARDFKLKERKYFDPQEKLSNKII